MNAYKKFIYNVLIFALIFLAADRIFGLLFKPIFNRQERGKYFTTSYAIKKAKEDLLIFGNSHAAQHFNANKLSDSLQVTAFNFGNQGQSILYYYPVLRSLLTHHVPRLVILNLDPDELLYNKPDYDRLSIFLPYYKENVYIDSSIFLIDKLEPYKAISNFYRFNSTIGYVFLNFFVKSYGKSNKSRGFDPQDGSLCKSGANKELTVEEAKNDDIVDTLKVRMLYQLIDELKKNKVNLMVTITPVYNSVISNGAGFKKLVSILAENHVEFCNYYSDERFTHNCELFHDQNHMNVTGADLFTDVVIAEIRKKNLLASANVRSQTAIK